MLWFDDQMDTVLVPCEHYRQQLVDHGFNPAKRPTRTGRRIPRTPAPGACWPITRPDHGAWPTGKIVLAPNKLASQAAPSEANAVLSKNRLQRKNLAF